MNLKVLPITKKKISYDSIELPFPFQHGPNHDRILWSDSGANLGEINGWVT